jgi:hypothetical protein
LPTRSPPSPPPGGPEGIWEAEPSQCCFERLNVGRRVNAYLEIACIVKKSAPRQQQIDEKKAGRRRQEVAGRTDEAWASLDLEELIHEADRKKLACFQYRLSY